MLIVENFLPLSYSNEIQNVLESNTFPWYGFGYTNGYSDVNHGDLFLDENTIDRKQLSHSLFSSERSKQSEWWSLFFPMLWVIETKLDLSPKFVDRAKINFLPRSDSYPSDSYTAPHTDVTPDKSLNCKTLIYYPFDSDGDTFIFNETHNCEFKTLSVNKRITPKANTLVIIDACTFHASSPPRDSDSRITLNMVFYA